MPSAAPVVINRMLAVIVVSDCGEIKHLVGQM